MEMFNDESWKSIYFGVKSPMSRCRVTTTLPAWVFALLWMLVSSRWACNNYCSSVAVHRHFRTAASLALTVIWLPVVWSDNWCMQSLRATCFLYVVGLCPACGVRLLKEFVWFEVVCSGYVYTTGTTARPASLYTANHLTWRGDCSGVV